MLRELPRETWLTDARQKRLVWALWSALLAADLIVGIARVVTGKPGPLVLPFAVALVGIALWIRRGRLAIAAHALSVLIAVTVLAMTYIAGELVPILHCLAVIPLFTTFVAGSRAGLLWCVVSLALLGLAALAVHYLPMPEPTGRALPGVSVAVVVSMVFSVAWAFERSRSSALGALQQRDDEAQTLFRLLPDVVLRIDGECSVLQRSSTDRLPSSLLDELFADASVKDAAVEALRADKEHEIIVGVAGRSLSLRLIPVAEEQLLALVRDRSDARRLEERATKAELIASLERANRMSSIGVLAACIAHEVNNPLAYLAGNLAFLDERAKRSATVDDEHRSAIADAMDATERVRTIVADLKHYSREDTESVSALRPSVVVDEALKIVRNEIRHIADVRTVFEHRSARVCAVETRLVQVIVNLLLNSAQALPSAEKGTNTIEVHTHAKDDLVEIVVIDNGPGIPVELLNRVTQPFFTTKDPGVGTGLGLAVCEEIVRQAEGQLLIENGAEGGAVVTVQLPRAASVTSTDDMPALDPRAARASRRGRILVVDDEPLVRRALIRLLREHDIVEADSGEKALELLGDGETFDVILCDVMMPVLSGLDVYAKVRSEFAPLDERIVFMTGGAFDPRLQDLMHTIANVPVLDKPFNPEQLRRVVGETMP